MVQALYYYLLFVFFFLVADLSKLKQDSFVASIIYGTIILIGAVIFFYLDHSFNPIYPLGLFTR